MKALLSCALMFIALPAFADSGLSGDNGLFISLGGGLSPFYVEEVIDGGSLAGGATVTSFNAETRLGFVFRDEFAAYALTSQNAYLDAQAQIYTSGLTGFGLQYFPNDFFNTYFLLGAGLGSKVVFATEAMQIATGLGYQVGIGRFFTDFIAVEANYKYLSLSKPAMDVIPGDSETISSVQLSIHLLLH